MSELFKWVLAFFAASITLIIAKGGGKLLEIREEFIELLLYLPISFYIIGIYYYDQKKYIYYNAEYMCIDIRSRITELTTYDLMTWERFLIHKKHKFSIIPGEFISFVICPVLLFILAARSVCADNKTDAMLLGASINLISFVLYILYSCRIERLHKIMADKLKQQP